MGREGRERGGRARLGYLSRGLEFLVTPLFEVWRVKGIGFGEGVKPLPRNFLVFSPRNGIVYLSIMCA